MLISLLFLIPLITFGQSLKELDYQEHYKKSGVSAQRVVLAHEDGPECLEYERTYDLQGRLIQEVSLFACGKTHSVQRFEYNEKNQLIRNTLAQVFMHFREIEFELIRNGEGQIIERKLKEPIPQGWQKETIRYHADGSIKTCTQWINQKAEWIILTEQSFDNFAKYSASRAKNSLSKVFDLNGLTLIHYRYTDAGEIKSTLRYTHSFHGEKVADSQ